MDIYLIIALS
uniref:Uncharacterized protein n=1 Tax=Arundo donax TaxID=35708 RepID=A0A0A9CLP4_ARUDO